MLVDERPVTKAGTAVTPDAAIRPRAEPAPYVSRGGEKLAGALAAFGLDVAGLVALDVGASTGGFTDCLPRAGARRVIAVDVGYGQLAWSPRQDPGAVNSCESRSPMCRGVPTRKSAMVPSRQPRMGRQPERHLAIRPSLAPLLRVAGGDDGARARLAAFPTAIRRAVGGPEGTPRDASRRGKRRDRIACPVVRGVLRARGYGPRSAVTSQGGWWSVPGTRSTRRSKCCCSTPSCRASSSWRSRWSRKSSTARRAGRRYKAVEPENRVVARTLEREWEAWLHELEHVERQCADARLFEHLLQLLGDRRG